MKPSSRRTDPGVIDRSIQRKSGVAALLAVLAILCLFAASATGTEIRNHGFFDMEAEFGNKDEVARRGTFDQHHLTVIWQADLDHKFRVLFETSYEHGPEIKGSGGDGKIYLPKAYCEYFQSDKLILRAGKFLPPFGIYNERHDATPTVIPTVLPQSVYGKHTNTTGTRVDDGIVLETVKARAYPRFSAGVWALGSVFLGENILSYSGYVTNGRGAQAMEKDDNRNKGLGGRLVLSPPRLPSLGVSYYTDRNGNFNDQQQSALGLDLEYALSSFLFESGLILPRNLDSTLAPDETDRNARGYYIMVGYTFGDRTTPFTYFDCYDPDIEVTDNQLRDWAIGVNHALRETVFLKAEIHFMSFEDSSLDSYRNLITSIAVAF